MSIVNVAKDLHGTCEVEIATLKMAYEDGGKIEVWSDSTRSVRVKGGANSDEIRAAFAKEPCT